MSNTFNFGRFGKIVRRDAGMVWPRMGAVMLLAVVVPNVISLAADVLELSKDADTRFWLVFVATIATGALTPSLLFRESNFRDEGIGFAMMPASKLEKFLSMMLFSFIVCPAIVMLSNLIIDTILWAIPATKFEGSMFSLNPSERSVYPTYIIYYAYLCVFNLIVSLFLFMGTIFGKGKTIGSIATFIILFIVVEVDFFIRLNFYLMDHNPDSILLETPFIEVVFSLVTIILVWLSWIRIKKMRY